jgi:hypothetical protein
MPCRQVSTYNGLSGSGQSGGGGYTTEADCLNACKEGACCDGTTCSVKPACQCQGTGQVFKGVGTVCAGVTCCSCGDGYVKSLFATFSNWVTLTGTAGAENIVLGKTWELTRLCGEKFWYYRGAISPSGRCPYSFCDLGYDLVISCGNERGVNLDQQFSMATRPGNCKNAWGVNYAVSLGTCSSGSASFPLYDRCYDRSSFVRLCDVTVTWNIDQNPLP